MKKIKLAVVLFISVLTTSLFAQNTEVVDTENAPVITFNKTSHDFGTINEGDKVETNYEFTNTGKSALLITRIKASCGCTVPSGWTKEPILPGESSKFTVKFNSRGKPNRQHKSVTVYCNTAKGREVVRFKAQVIPDPEMEKMRAERAEKRKVQMEQRKLEQQKKLEAQKAGGKLELKETPKREYPKKEVVEVKKGQASIEKEIKEVKKEAKKIESDNNKIEKDLKKTEKEAKKVEKERKKIEKETKKIEKLNGKIASASKKLRKSESKLAKMESKLDINQAKGKLSPQDIAKKEKAILKQNEKIKKEGVKLRKLQNKL